MDQSVSGRSVSGSEAHCQGPEAALGGSLESFAVVKKIPVEVKADVCLQALRKTLQHLQRTKQKGLQPQKNLLRRALWKFHIYVHVIFLINDAISHQMSTSFQDLCTGAAQSSDLASFFSWKVNN